MNYDDLLKQVMSKFEEGGYDAVFDYIDNFIEENPGSFEAYLIRSELDTESGAFENALDDAEKAIKINPNQAIAYNNRGCIYVKSGGDINKALSDFNKAIELNANFAGAYNNRAKTYLKMRELQKAINDCIKAIEISPEDMEPYYNRGLAYMNTGEIARAFDDYNMVIKLAPENSEAYAKRGFLNSQLGNTQEAIRDYEEFLRLDANNANAELVRNALRDLRSGKVPSTGSTTSSGGCYVATCVYGSYDCQEVWTLRRFRDNELSNLWLGKCFIRIYYAVSPKIVELFGNKKLFSRLWKPIINKIVRKLQNNEVYKNEKYL